MLLPSFGLRCCRFEVEPGLLWSKESSSLRTPTPYSPQTITITPVALDHPTLAPYEDAGCRNCILQFTGRIRDLGHSPGANRPRPNPATEFVASRRLPPVASARVPTQGKTPRLHDRSGTTVFDLTAGSPSPRRTLRGTPRAAASRIAPLATLWAARARGSSGASSLPVSARDGRGISP